MNKKVFIIENDANILHGLNANLSLDGFQIEIDQGQEEIATLLNKIILFKPDFIVLDVLLGINDGFDILASIKASDDLNKTRVFIFSNYNSENAKKRCADLGANYYFLKSEFNLEEFAQKVKKIIKNLHTN